MQFRLLNISSVAMHSQTQLLLSRYSSEASRLHQLDPVTKASIFIFAILAIFAADSWLSLAIVGAYLFMLCLCSGAKIVFYLRSLRNFSWMFAITFGVNLIFPRYGGRAFTSEALGIASHFTLRLAFMILAATFLTVVMAPSEIGDVVMLFGRFGGKVGRMASDLGTMLTIAIRFMPVLAEEAERIKTAQILRGRHIGGLRSRIRFIIDLIIPLIDAALRRSTNLGFALEARCYGWHQATHRKIKLRLADRLALAFASGVLTSVLLERLL